jgi:hypothetical protein
MGKRKNIEETKGVPLIKVNEDLSIFQYCADKHLSSEVNIESILDIMSVVEELTYLTVIKDPSSNVIDVVLNRPKIDEDLIVFAMKNVIEFGKMKQNAQIDDKDLNLLRRVRLRKFILDREKKE